MVTASTSAFKKINLRETLIFSVIAFILPLDKTSWGLYIARDQLWDTFQAYFPFQPKLEVLLEPLIAASKF